MKREDYLFCIGYQSDNAVVDRQARAKYGQKSTEELARAGLFRAALCSALYSRSDDEMAMVISIYNRTAGTSCSSSEEMKRLLGVSDPPEGSVKVMPV